MLQRYRDNNLKSLSLCSPKFGRQCCARLPARKHLKFYLLQRGTPTFRWFFLTLITGVQNRRLLIWLAFLKSTKTERRWRSEETSECCHRVLGQVTSFSASKRRKESQKGGNFVGCFCPRKRERERERRRKIKIKGDKVREKQRLKGRDRERERERGKG